MHNKIHSLKIFTATPVIVTLQAVGHSYYIAIASVKFNNLTSIAVPGNFCVREDILAPGEL
jgi:hypothetical protein